MSYSIALCSLHRLRYGNYPSGALPKVLLSFRANTTNGSEDKRAFKTSIPVASIMHVNELYRHDVSLQKRKWRIMAETRRSATTLSDALRAGMYIASYSKRSSTLIAISANNAFSTSVPVEMLFLSARSSLPRSMRPSKADDTPDFCCRLLLRNFVPQQKSGVSSA